MRGLSDKVVIVTGGASGIGKATCLRFADEGSKVAIFDLNGDGASEVADSINNEGGTAASFTLDLADYGAVQKAVADAEAALGPIDIMVNNAGWDRFEPFLKNTPDFWNKIIGINLLSVFNMHHAVIPGMVERGAGRVVNIASDAGRGGSSGEAVYSACKGGIIAFGKTMAREHSRQNITFNTVCPGVTDTPLFDGFLEGSDNPEKLLQAFTRAVPLGRIGTPDDLPGAILFLSSDDAAFITGQTISVSGGLTMHG